MKTSLFLGASGRIGSLLRQAEFMEQRSSSFYWQFRRWEDCNHFATVHWPEFSDPRPIVQFLRKRPYITSMFVFVGATGQKHKLSRMVLNVSLVLKAIHAAHLSGIKRVVVASSSAVYGAYGHAPFHESSRLCPLTRYGESKCLMEREGARLAEALGIEFVALRIGNVVGADGLLTNALARKDTGLDLDIFDDCLGPVRSYVGPLDLLTILETLATHDGALPRHLNVAAHRAVSMDALLDASAIPWRSRYGADPAHQYITLETTRLAEVMPRCAIEDDPAGLIEQWRSLLDGEQLKELTRCA